MQVDSEDILVKELLIIPDQCDETFRIMDFSKNCVESYLGGHPKFKLLNVDLNISERLVPAQTHKLDAHSYDYFLENMRTALRFSANSPRSQKAGLVHSVASCLTNYQQSIVHLENFPGKLLPEHLTVNSANYKRMVIDSKESVLVYLSKPGNKLCQQFEAMLRSFQTEVLYVQEYINQTLNGNLEKATRFNDSKAARYQLTSLQGFKDLRVYEYNVHNDATNFTLPDCAATTPCLLLYLAGKKSNPIQIQLPELEALVNDRVSFVHELMRQLDQKLVR